jgi:hypothetical protein
MDGFHFARAAGRETRFTVTKNLLFIDNHP